MALHHVWFRLHVRHDIEQFVRDFDSAHNAAFGRLQSANQHWLFISHFFFCFYRCRRRRFSFLWNFLFQPNRHSGRRVGDTQQTSLFIVVCCYRIEFRLVGWQVWMCMCASVSHAHAFARSLARSLFNDEKWHETNKYWMVFIISIRACFVKQCVNCCEWTATAHPSLYRYPCRWGN